MNTLIIEAKLAEKYMYKPLPDDLSQKYREFFRENIPDWLNVDGSAQAIYTNKGSLIANGYNRIVVGDYGAFVEFSEKNLPDQFPNPTLSIPADQLYRVADEQYSRHVKYIWMTIPDGSNIKVYLQKKCVSYADYKPGMYYVSVHEVFAE